MILRCSAVSGVSTVASFLSSLPPIHPNYLLTSREKTYTEVRIYTSKLYSFLYWFTIIVSKNRSFLQIAFLLPVVFTALCQNSSLFDSISSWLIQKVDKSSEYGVLALAPNNFWCLLADERQCGLIYLLNWGPSKEKVESSRRNRDESASTGH